MIFAIILTAIGVIGLIATILSGPVLTRRKEQQLSESAAQWLRDNAERQIEGIDFSGSGSTDGRARTRRDGTGRVNPAVGFLDGAKVANAIPLIAPTLAGNQPGPLPDSLRKEVTHARGLNQQRASHPDREKIDREAKPSEAGAQNFKMEKMTSEQHSVSPLGRWTTRN